MSEKIVQLNENLFSATPRSKVKLVAKMLKAVTPRRAKKPLERKPKPWWKSRAP